jgi:hypothetical protein
MNRRLGFAVLVIAMVVAACGRQVTGLNTPNGGSIASGTMLIRVNVAGTLDFNNYKYLIVFNTSGTGGEPLPQAYANGFQNYSYSLLFAAPTGSQGVQAPLAQLLQYYLNPGTTSGLQTYNVIIPVQSLQFTPNENGLGSQFQVQFERQLLDQPSVTGSAAPAGSPVASPSPSPGTTAAPKASATPAALPTNASQVNWYINFIVTDSSGVPVDSMGTGGATDTSYTLEVNTSQAQTINYTKPAGAVVPSSPNEQLTGFSLINQP